MHHSLNVSGVVGMDGRFVVPDADAPHPSALVLDGAPLPMVGKLRVYTCGITPYDVTHLGHAAVFVWTDLLRSLAHAVEVDTLNGRNVTDVDDVLTAAARGRGWPYDEFALAQEFHFDQDMASLGVAAPDSSPRARAHVRQAIQLASALLGVGQAYEHNGTVYFRGAELATRSNLSLDQAIGLSDAFGDQADDGREHPLDVPVWRPSPAEHPAWPSPWGWGRPGWHAECAAMASTVFGASVDVLVGGADLAFPHHAYQAAMVEAASAVTPFARRQMHVGTVDYRGSKMAKSTGNLVLVKDLLEIATGPAVRLMLLNRPWSASWEYDEHQLAAASELVDALHVAAGRPGSDAHAVAQVTAALLDDLDVPRAIAIALEAGGEPARFLCGVLKLT